MRWLATSRWHVPSLIGMILILPTLGCGEATVATRPTNARAFVDSIGVNVHLYYEDTTYRDYDLIKARLQDLGVRHIRDQCGATHAKGTYYARLNDLASAGVHTSWIAGRPGLNGSLPGDIDECLADAKHRIRGALEAMENPNEYDLSGDPDWVKVVREYARRLHAFVRGRHRGPPLSAPVIAPSLARPDAHDALGDIGAYVEGGNAHCYPDGQPPNLGSYGQTLEGCLGRAKLVSGGDPVIATETGYHDATACDMSKMSESGGCSGHRPTQREATAIYLPRLYFEYWIRDVKRTFVYELADEKPDPCYCNSERHFGLIWPDGRRKPQFHALKNLISLLDGPVSSTLEPLAYSVEGAEDPDGSGPGGAVASHLLQKGDGSWWLALWQRSSVWNPDTRQLHANPPRRVAVTFQRAVDATLYRPTYGTRSTGAARRVTSLTVDVPDDLVLVKLTT